MTLCEMSRTLCPLTSANVSVELTSGLPNSVCAAKWWSRWAAAVFWVRRVNQMLSVVVMVRPTPCS